MIIPVSLTPEGNFSISMNLSDAIRFAEFLLILVAAIGGGFAFRAYVKAKTKIGTDKADAENDGIRNETISLLKEQRDAYQGQFNDQLKINKDLSDRVSYLQGVVDERDKKEAVYKEIFTAALTNHLNAHPEAVQTLKSQI